ncbi:hypothetical protein G5I_14053 [Acromyrmex echinatior]|uniref:Uncharacterized protein n=1 Tax=Acromyrmex echinatior TaxID=103372 RepID=F4X6T4_ACREC|nr:hypothetical protein G5I_14053 [Acromyrmex echinatior]
MRGINYVALIARLPVKVERILRVDPEITGQQRKRQNNNWSVQSLVKFTPRRLSMAVASELPHYELITETVADNFAIKVPALAMLLTLLRFLFFVFHGSDTPFLDTATRIPVNNRRFYHLKISCNDTKTIRGLNSIRSNVNRMESSRLYGRTLAYRSPILVTVYEIRAEITFIVLCPLRATSTASWRLAAFSLHGENFPSVKRGPFVLLPVTSQSALTYYWRQ